MVYLVVQLVVADNTSVGESLRHQKEQLVEVGDTLFLNVVISYIYIYIFDELCIKLVFLPNQENLHDKCHPYQRRQPGEYMQGECSLLQN